jgi:hypothetical protein
MTLRPNLGPLFDKARADADLEKVGGVKLYGGGQQRRGECPICHASKGKKAGGAFAAWPKTARWHCYSCERSGDVVDLEHILRSRGDETLKDAAERLVGTNWANQPAPVAGPRVSSSAPDPADTWKLDLARALWLDSRRAPGTPVETYLRARGIAGWVLDKALGRLRYHPAAYHHGGPGREVCAPAMIGLVKVGAGATGGVHVTYLRPDGRGKSALDPAKKMWGPQGLDGAPGGVWLTSVNDNAGPLIVAEGIESALSAAMLIGGECRIAAALSLGHLQGGWVLDAYGRLDPDCVRGDPERPPFLWAAPADRPWKSVVIAVDRDMKPVRVKCRKAAGGTYQRALTADERARICAALAEDAWRRIGTHAVRSIAPAAGRDFNDELCARIRDGWSVAA